MTSQNKQIKTVTDLEMHLKDNNSNSKYRRGQLFPIPPTVSECNTTVINTNLRSVTIYQTHQLIAL